MSVGPACIMPDEVHADVGGVGPGVLLEVHELLGDGQPPAAELRGPGQPGVAGVVELALPGGVVGAAGRPVARRRRRPVRGHRRPRARPAPRPGTPRRRRSSVRSTVSSRSRGANEARATRRTEVDLARVGAGQRVDDPDLGRQLVAGQDGVPRCVEQVVGRTRRRCPARSSTAATGTAPSRSSATPITAAPRTRGRASSAARTSSGRTLKPPRMIAWSARPRIHRKPSASMRARSVVRIQPPSVAELARPSPRAGPPRRGRAPRPSCSGRRPAARTRRGPGRRCPAWSSRTARGRRGSSRRRRRRTRWRRRRSSTGMPYFVVERVGVVGRQRRGAARRPSGCWLRSARVEVGVEHHAQRGRHQAGGLRSVAADGVDPAVDGEPLEQAERPTVVDALQRRGTARRGGRAAS